MSLLTLSCPKCHKLIACVCTDSGDQGNCLYCIHRLDCPYKDAVPIEASDDCADCSQLYKVVR
jgi:hypothetical protein